ncbi:MAG: 50S ribosomal protein L17 [Candidatus Cloacimonadota bacterium]|nr:MAG: 50S ribosomal protein L17 [Candidatus Cloacimonadota bacterium]
MRHRVNGRKFGRESGHRNLMLKNLVKSLVEYGRINTTLAKAKEIRSLAERLITYGKKNTVHHRRLAFRILQNRTLVKKVFDELAPQFSDREGGYTRVLKTGFRKGDAAEMAIIEFIQKEKEETGISKKKN